MKKDNAVKVATKLLLAVVISVFIVSLCFTGLCYVLLSLWGGQRSPQILLIYHPNDVQYLCDILELNAQDPFCSYSNQDADSLIRMLERRLPIHETSYEDVIFALEELYIECWFVPGNKKQIYPRNFDTSEIPYTCWFDVIGSNMYISVYFDTSDGHVIRYGALRPAEGG